MSIYNFRIKIYFTSRFSSEISHFSQKRFLTISRTLCSTYWLISQFYQFSQNFLLHVKKNLIQNAEIHIRTEDAESILCKDRKERRLDQSKVDYREIKLNERDETFRDLSTIAVGIRFWLVSFTVCEDFMIGSHVTTRRSSRVLRIALSPRLILFTAFPLFRIGTSGFKTNISQIVPVFFPEHIVLPKDMRKSRMKFYLQVIQPRISIILRTLGTDMHHRKPKTFTFFFTIFFTTLPPEFIDLRVFFEIF